MKNLTQQFRKLVANISDEDREIINESFSFLSEVLAIFLIYGLIGFIIIANL